MKIKKPIVRILIWIIVGLCAGAVADYAFLWLSFPVFSIFGMVIGACVSGIVEVVKYRRSIRDRVTVCKGPDLERLPISAAEFIKLVIKKMRYRKKVRAEVTAELAAHFEDGLRECESDEDKEQKAQRLIADFGDVKLLGVLLRRAKKRCRPLWRTVIARACQAVDILFICFVLYLVWFLTGKPVITTNYVAELNRMVRPVADETLNAAPLYHKAAELYAKLPEETSKAFHKKYNEATPEEKKLIEKFIVDNNEVFELVIAGTQKPYYWHNYANKENTGDTMSILLPKLSEFRKLAYSLCWRARLRAEQGRYEEAFSDIKSCYRLGQHNKGDKTLIEQLVGIAVEALAVGTLHDILGEHEIDSAKLAVLQKDFEQMVASEDFAVSFEAEKLFAYDGIQRCFSEDRFGGGHLCLEGFKLIGSLIGEEEPFELIFRRRGLSAPLHILFTHPNKQESREMVDRMYVFWDEMARKTPAQIRAEKIDIDERVMEIVRGNILLEILHPALGRVSELSYRAKTDVEGTVTVLGLLRYEKDKGFYPEDLQELIAAGYLEELPIDPFSGEPLVYKKIDNNFMLYSVSHNFKDDGGEVVRDGRGRVRKWDNEGDAVFWPRPKPKSPEEREKEDRERRPMLGKRHIPLRKGKVGRK